MSNVVVARRVARDFWQQPHPYPSQELIRRRRWYELEFLVPHIYDCDSLVDIGCGDGSLVACLLMLTNLHTAYLADQTPGIPTRLVSFPEVVYECRDVMQPRPFPAADVTIATGVLNYAFDEPAAVTLLGNVRSQRLYLRSPCTEKPEDELVCRHSDELGTEYAALYRTRQNVRRLVEAAGFSVLTERRAYPDGIESKYDTRQWLWWAMR